METLSSIKSALDLFENLSGQDALKDIVSVLLRYFNLCLRIVDKKKVLPSNPYFFVDLTGKALAVSELCAELESETSLTSKAKAQAIVSAAKLLINQINLILLEAGKADAVHNQLHSDFYGKLSAFENISVLESYIENFPS